MQQDDIGTPLPVDEGERRFKVFSVTTLEALETALNDEAMYAYSLVSMTPLHSAYAVVMELTPVDVEVDYLDPESVNSS